MAVVNRPDPPHNWRDSDGNVDWDAYASEGVEITERDPEVLGIAIKNGKPQGVAVRWAMERLGEGRSIDRGYGGCATCDDGGCGDCRAAPATRPPAAGADGDR